MSNGEYHLIYVEPDSLHAAEWQPPSRTEASTSIGALQKSIGIMGLQYPLLVVHRPNGDGYSIVDGHRRYAAIMALRKEGKWPRGVIAVLVATGSPKDLFASVSGTTRALTATQWVHVHLRGGAVPNGPTKSAITQLERVMGRDFLEKLRGAELSPQIWNLAGRVIKYLGLPDDDKPNVISWLFSGKLTRPVGAWITQGHDRKELMLAFQERREPSLVRQAA